MILTDLRRGTTLYRAHTPRWADCPMSGAGAALKGGRFNREGVEALYLSLEELTALREYQQTSPFLPPCTICSYAAELRTWWTCGNSTAETGMSFGTTGARIGGIGSSTSTSSPRPRC
jgi:RES domain-containing protein